MNGGVCGKLENGKKAMKQSPEEKKECRGWFHVAGAATSSTLEMTMVREGKVGGNDVFRNSSSDVMHVMSEGPAHS